MTLAQASTSSQKAGRKGKRGTTVARNASAIPESIADTEDQSEIEDNDATQSASRANQLGKGTRAPPKPRTTSRTRGRAALETAVESEVEAGTEADELSHASEAEELGDVTIKAKPKKKTGRGKGKGKRAATADDVEVELEEAPTRQIDEEVESIADEAPAPPKKTTSKRRGKAKQKAEIVESASDADAIHNEDEMDQEQRSQGETEEAVAVEKPKRGRKPKATATTAPEEDVEQSVEESQSQALGRGRPEAVGDSRPTRSASGRSQRGGRAKKQDTEVVADDDNEVETIEAGIDQSAAVDDDQPSEVPDADADVDEGDVNDHVETEKSSKSSRATTKTSKSSKPSIKARSKAKKTKEAKEVESQTEVTSGTTRLSTSSELTKFANIPPSSPFPLVQPRPGANNQSKLPKHSTSVSAPARRGQISGSPIIELTPRPRHTLTSTSNSAIPSPRTNLPRDVLDKSIVSGAKEARAVMDDLVLNSATSWSDEDLRVLSEEQKGATLEELVRAEMKKRYEVLKREGEGMIRQWEETTKEARQRIEAL